MNSTCSCTSTCSPADSGQPGAGARVGQGAATSRGWRGRHQSHALLLAGLRPPMRMKAPVFYATLGPCTLVPPPPSPAVAGRFPGSHPEGDLLETVASVAPRSRVSSSLPCWGHSTERRWSARSGPSRDLPAPPNACPGLSGCPAHTPAAADTNADSCVPVLLALRSPHGKAPRVAGFASQRARAGSGPGGPGARVTSVL